ncbi:uncharacterized protein LOC113463897 [Ceratina calcarata]|uniref:Uncharacterized protein LOC113463897 n=1 Tax=Ceratina calcarata TaxID=156304 RepID=A0AAJ7RW52_9HYME|nr:uncharacterized protein LOC113463897 [Ceratina calcarata]
METRTFCFVAVFLATFATTTPESLDTSTEEALVASEAQNVLDECQNSDYRTYIKCLKRQKRHHFPHSDFDPTCLDSCPKRCHTEHECEMKCGHCMRKTKHRHQIITEYETECSSGECRNTTSSDKELGSTNITTKIDIHNVINNNVTSMLPII